MSKNRNHTNTPSKKSHTESNSIGEERLICVEMDYLPPIETSPIDHNRGAAPPPMEIPEVAPYPPYIPLNQPPYSGIYPSGIYKILI